MDHPHSWRLADWPPGVYPGSPERGKYITRKYRDELLKAGAVVRIGRELVYIGRPYDKWMKKKAAHVPGYQCNANPVEQPAA